MATHPQASFKTTRQCLNKIGVGVLASFIRAYQYLLSPWLGRHCRFYPSCSHYALEALQAHGLLSGCGLTLRRLCKCHPWHPGGCDPVPAKPQPQLNQ